MCGIAGYLRAPGRADWGTAPVAAMCEHMRSRGPHADAIWQGPAQGAVLGHRRLAVIDLDPRSNQPMESRSGNLAIVFNGEIYNFRELRTQLESQNVELKTHGDTEVILALWEREGIAALDRLRGMFAFGLLDRRTSKTFLVRDPYGIKPLYYAKSADGLLFASQVKALLATGRVSQTRDRSALAAFYTWGHIPDPRTFVRDIRAVPAGTCLEIDERTDIVKQTTYAPLSKLWSNAAARSVGKDELSALVGDAVRHSVHRHHVSDRPICTFLSGGIDSAVVASQSGRLAPGSAGVTIVYDEFAGTANDEGPPAKLIADTFGIRHHLRRVSADEFKAELDRIVGSMDQPSIDGINTWFAAKGAAELGFNVVLSGVGGDELFGGYPSFRNVPAIARAGGFADRILGGAAVATALGKAASRVLGKPKLAQTWPLSQSLLGAYALQRGVFLPDDLISIVGQEEARDAAALLSDPIPESRAILNATGWPGLVSYLETTHYLRHQLLRDADWASMAHSIELRTPLVDYQLAAAIAPHAQNLVGAFGKTLLGRAAVPPLPAQIANRPKTGFGVPMKRFLNTATPDRPWMRYPALAHDGVHWSRQWAVTIAERFGFI